MFAPFLFIHLVDNVHFYFTDTDGMLSQALLVGNFEAAVDICISADRMVSKNTQTNVHYIVFSKALCCH